MQVEQEQEELLKGMQKDELKRESENLISLCKDFNQEDGVATKIENISRLLNGYIEDESLFPQSVRDIVYNMTKLITFLAQMHESASRVNRLEYSIENNTKL